MTGGLLSDTTVAVLVKVPAVPVAVPLVTCTLAVPLGASVPKLQLSVSFGGAPSIVQVPGPAYAGLIDQSMPVPLGNGSESLVFTEEPVPPFVTVTVKPIGLPALTGDWSAVFTTDRADCARMADGLDSGCHGSRSRRRRRPRT